jgi:hypothetical protein
MQQYPKGLLLLQGNPAEAVIFVLSASRILERCVTHISSESPLYDFCLIIRGIPEMKYFDPEFYIPCYNIPAALLLLVLLYHFLG